MPPDWLSFPAFFRGKVGQKSDKTKKADRDRERILSAFDFSPVLCRYLAGFLRLFRLVTFVTFVTGPGAFGCVWVRSGAYIGQFQPGPGSISDSLDSISDSLDSISDSIKGGRVCWFFRLGPFAYIQRGTGFDSVRVPLQIVQRPDRFGAVPLQVSSAARILFPSGLCLNKKDSPGENVRENQARLVPRQDENILPCAKGSRNGGVLAFSVLAAAAFRLVFLRERTRTDSGRLSGKNTGRRVVWFRIKKNPPPGGRRKDQKGK